MGFLDTNYGRMLNEQEKITVREIAKLLNGKTAESVRFILKRILSELNTDTIIQLPDTFAEDEQPT